MIYFFWINLSFVTRLHDIFPSIVDTCLISHCFGNLKNSTVRLSSFDLPSFSKTKMIQLPTKFLSVDNLIDMNTKLMPLREVAFPNRPRVRSHF